MTILDKHAQNMSELIRMLATEYKQLDPTLTEDEIKGLIIGKIIFNSGTTLSKVADGLSVTINSVLEEKERDYAVKTPVYSGR